MSIVVSFSQHRPLLKGAKSYEKVPGKQRLSYKQSDLRQLIMKGEQCDKIGAIFYHWDYIWERFVSQFLAQISCFWVIGALFLAGISRLNEVAQKLQHAYLATTFWRLLLKASGHTEGEEV